ncbi:MAG: hypothetical protein COS82_02050 [Zetaproteobacteria bacterium CG06_land_8_20_14_3_00_59_53]|nr:MAG: hypothetical protein COX56_03735 [Zetaproteobacteria bacterium CG23_combo_of_CG06-09_8_20_14_all_59_86]PIQ64614.1 MAG: hypothetical protein COV97_08590 [Zetaproteobacteria bacterium CG11_big_fil_rev_8_21_14_0_20_59_439]PIU71314.1 MAG: hypothetical protein COS82_02050 [Zetaproteobacteria bacterium CG06_land_8_20_14_3_00_59_53]PIU97250.1 MAG: hypothetical protein COS62_05045 [Zetaproteobacteria bacterium CG03_land_8_20_14_0_80_59_51]PIY46012.1 MAG: hypothetical protein COZ02_07435 [Zetapr
MANVEFCFKGEFIDACAAIDLDLCLRHGEPMHYIYHELGAQNGIGTHTYEFDVMVMEPVEFSHPTGLACRFLADGHLDFDALHQAWEAEKIDDILKPIALRHLGIARLEEHPAIKAALVEAYLAS